MPLFFITANSGKFAEAKAVLPDLERLDIDLPEIQTIDPEAIIKHKLKAAFAYHPGPLMVEDTGLYLDCLNGLPGPLVKWFLKSIGNKGLADLAAKLDNPVAKAKTVIGYGKSGGDIRMFTGVVKGQIVEPAGAGGFGWNPIFRPAGYDQTFAEMAPRQKRSCDMRRAALEQLQRFLEAADGR